MTDAERDDLMRHVLQLRRTVGALIAWIAQSATAPISRDDAAILIRMLDGDEP